MKKLWHYIEKAAGVYRWHPKIALRYLPVVHELKKRFKILPVILEVGSGGLGIAPYINSNIVGVDIDFSGPLHPNLIPVQASAVKLPFVSNSFTAVVSLDLLEHIPPASRKQVIKEMLRVADQFVAIGVPCGRESELQDEKLKQLYKHMRGDEYAFLAEQVEYGLPEKMWISDTIKSMAKILKKRVNLSSIGNINLSVRMFLMRGWLSRNIIINVVFRKVFLLFIPLLRRLNQKPVYRHIFFVDIQHDT